MKKPIFRIAHISDLHFSSPTWNPTQLFCKRWVGNLNLLISRQHNFSPAQLDTLIPLFQELKVDHVIITGDFTTTSYEKEFVLAKAFVDKLKQADMNVFALPGNHDHYTKSAYEKRLFYQYFDAAYPHSTHDLKKDRLTSTYLGNEWWLVALDTALATALFSANGHFSEELEHKLEETLKSLPEQHNIILINHFPFFQNDAKHKRLLRGEELKKVLEKFPNVKLYLHGHTHRQCMADLKNSRLPLILDSGSTAAKQKGTWNLIDIYQDGCEVEVFKSAKDSWAPIQQSSFAWA